MKYGQQKRFFCLLGATLVALFLSQVPYYRTWIYGSPMPFDGFFGFPSWFVSQIHDLVSGHHPFSIRSDLFPGLVAPPYSGAGIVRLFLTLILPNDMSAHAYIQCVHIGLTVVAVAALFSTFLVPWYLGLLGGLIFMQSGIQLSLSQHVVAHEALLYLIGALLCIRLYIRGRSQARGMYYEALCLISLTVSISGLTWWFHDTIHYCLPMVFWTFGHLFLYRTPLENVKGMRGTILSLGAVGIVALMLFIPNILCAIEMSYVNKSQVAQFAGGQSYPAPLLLAGLFFPHVTAGLDIKGLDFTFGDANLFYFFLGSCSLFLNFCFIKDAWHKSQKLTVSLFVTGLILSFGFALGAGSFLHYILCLLFPPMGYLRHNYYGLKCLYLLCAFGNVKGLQFILECPQTNYWLIMLRAVTIQAIFSLYFIIYVLEYYPSFLESSLVLLMKRDIVWFLGINSGLTGALLFYRYKIVTKYFMGILLCSLLYYDLSRPALWQHFLPHEDQASSYSEFSGGLAPVRPYLRFFENQKKGGAGFSFRPLRVFSKDVWLWPDHLYPIGIANISTMDSQGSGDFERMFAGEYQDELPSRIVRLAEEYGIDYFWIGGANQDIKNSLEEKREFLFGMENEWLGAIHQYRFDFYRLYRYSDQGMLLRWFLPSDFVTRSDSLFDSSWQLNLPSRVNCRSNRQVSLPFMWLSMFSVRSGEGAEVAFDRDSYGRISVPCNDQVSHLILAYPKRSAKVIMIVSIVLKFMIILASLVIIPFLLYSLARKR